MSWNFKNPHYDKLASQGGLHFERLRLFWISQAMADQHVSALNNSYVLTSCSNGRNPWFLVFFTWHMRENPTVLWIRNYNVIGDGKIHLASWGMLQKPVCRYFSWGDACRRVHTRVCLKPAGDTLHHRAPYMRYADSKHYLFGTKQHQRPMILHLQGHVHGVLALVCHDGDESPFAPAGGPAICATSYKTVLL